MVWTIEKQIESTNSFNHDGFYGNNWDCQSTSLEGVGVILYCLNDSEKLVFVSIDEERDSGLEKYNGTYISFPCNNVLAEKASQTSAAEVADILKSLPIWVGYKVHVFQNSKEI